MNKNIINTVLRTGFSATKKTVKEVIGGLYPLEKIFRAGFGGAGIICNQNQFWDITNKQNSIDLIHDIKAIKRANIQDTAYYHILVRFEHGDAYGIVKE